MTLNDRKNNSNNITSSSSSSRVNTKHFPDISVSMLEFQDFFPMQICLDVIIKLRDLWRQADMLICSLLWKENCPACLTITKARRSVPHLLFSGMKARRCSVKQHGDVFLMMLSPFHINPLKQRLSSLLFLTWCVSAKACIWNCWMQNI